MADQTPFAAVELATNPEPRCPCVLLLDTSGSMSGVPIAHLNLGLLDFKADVTADPLAAQRVEVAVVAFGGAARTVTPFTSASQFVPPTLTTAGDTPLGAAVLLGLDMVAERKALYKQSGLAYYRPWVILITDGGPTDRWKPAADAVKAAEAAKQVAFFAIGTDGADFDTLRKLAVREPLRLKGHSFREFFSWLSSSMRSVSQSRPGEEHAVALPSPAGWASL